MQVIHGAPHPQGSPPAVVQHGNPTRPAKPIIVSQLVHPLSIGTSPTYSLKGTKIAAPRVGSNILTGKELAWVAVRLSLADLLGSVAEVLSVDCCGCKQQGEGTSKLHCCWSSRFAVSVPEDEV